MKLYIKLMLAAGFCCWQMQVSALTNINGYEYWFDNDYANRVTANFSPVAVYTFDQDLPTAGLSPGPHFLRIRFRDTANVYSPTLNHFFYKAPPASASDGQITAYEYWYDNGPTRTLVDVPDTDVLNVADALGSAALPAGVHTLHFRALDKNGAWSPTLNHFFYKAPPASASDGQITAYEYWYDNGPTRTLVDVPDTDVLNVADALGSAALPAGVHTLHFRALDKNGAWSPTLNHFFYKAPPAPPLGLVAGYRYWFDGDTAAMQNVTLPAPVNPLILDLEINTGGLPNGQHTVHFQFKDTNGNWSVLLNEVFEQACIGVPYFADGDSDGFGNANVSQTSCAPPTGYVANDDDCNDANPGIYPGASETACNGTDENCDGNDHLAGNALDFDGTDDYVQLPADTFFNGGPFTIEAWVYPKSYGHFARILDFGANPSTNNVMLAYLAGTGKITLIISNGGEHFTTASDPLPLNQWTHVAAVYAGGGSTAIYYNGQLVGSSTTAPPPVNILRPDCFLGKSYASWDAYNHVALDEFRLWDVARTPAQLYETMNCSPGAASGLLVHFDFNQGTAGGSNGSHTTVPDLSGNGYTGMLHNFALAGTNSNWVASGAIVNGSCTSAPAEVCNQLDDDCDGLIDDPLALTVASMTNVACNGASTGAIDISPSCGLLPYSFAWSNGATTEDLTDIPAGTYTVTLTDNQGLVQTLSATVIQPAAFGLTFYQTQPSCNDGSNGKVTASPVGNVNTYTYLWNTGATSRILSNIPAGTYTVTVTKINTGCTRAATATLAEPAPISIALTITHPKCFGAATGLVTASASGGTGTKTYAWSTGGTGIKIQNLAAGNYTVTATDSKGCTKTAIASLTEPTELEMTFSTEILSNGKMRVTLSASGGTPYTSGPAYKFCKVSPTGSCGFVNTNVYSNLIPTQTYLFRARDKNGCVDEVAVGGTAKPAQTRTSDGTEPGFEIAPNPHTDKFFITKTTEADTDLRLQILDLTGRVVAEDVWPAASDALEIQTGDWPAGVFFVKILGINGAAVQVLRSVKTE